MVLRSQAPRPDSPSSYVSIYKLRRRRRNRRLTVVIVLLGGAALAAYALWPSGGAGRTRGPGSPHPVTQSSRPTPVPNPVAGEKERPISVSPSPAASPRPVNARPENPTPPRPGAERKQAPAVLVAGDPAVTRLLIEAQKLIEADKLLEARDVLSGAYGQKPGGADGGKLRGLLAQINEVMIFSPRIIQGDPFEHAYLVQPGDFLSTIAAGVNVPWKFISRINNVEPSRLRVGATIKLIKGPFHGVVHKSDYRLDLYLGDPSKPGALYLRSFTIGLGTEDSTPIGRFIVKRGGKAQNPDWRNPRDAKEYYAANDPRNPIGERWIGLRGVDEASQKFLSYGIHGTIDPSSIGRQASMGCVRMRDDDVALVYDMLSEEKSTVTIVP